MWYNSGRGAEQIMKAAFCTVGSWSYYSVVACAANDKEDGRSERGRRIIDHLAARTYVRKFPRWRFFGIQPTVGVRSSQTFLH